MKSGTVKTVTDTACVFAVCVCVGGWSVRGCVCVCVSGMLICFVSALGFHEMGRHKLPIIIIITDILVFCYIVTDILVFGYIVTDILFFCFFVTEYIIDIVVFTA